MSELEQEYGDRVRFVIIPAEETARSQAAIDEYGFTDLKHGLVIYDADGAVAFKLAGHRYGRAEIEAGLLPVLAAN